jgi:hypothetical protein
MSNKIVAAGNTYNPCLLILKEKGYSLWAENAKDQVIWNARNDDREFSGYSPPELLGIVVLWETLREGWNQQSPNVLGEIGGEAE